MESILSFAQYILWVGLALSVLVFIHELGHFWAAKLFGMRVEQFSIGFPPKIYGKTIGETEYRIGALPLGGYVKISGMIDESMDADFVGKDPEPWEFRSKPVWQRIIVITAGVVFNILFAIGIFTTLNYVYGDRYIPAENVSALSIDPASIAENMGMESGDMIIAVNGEPFNRFDALFNIETITSDQFILTILRDSAEITLPGPTDLGTQLKRRGDELGENISPYQLFGISFLPSLIGAIVEDGPAGQAGILPGDKITAINGEDVLLWNNLVEHIQGSDGEPLSVTWSHLEEDSSYTFQTDSITALPHEDSWRIGIQSPTNAMLYDEYGVAYVQFGFFESLTKGFSDMVSMTMGTLNGFKKIFSGQEDLRENLGGPVAIAKVTRTAAEQGAGSFWNVVAVLSITLAIINIMPIPALDGGHLVFLIYEGITRREPPVKFRMIVQQIGMLVLLTLMVFLIFNDILRF